MLKFATCNDLIRLRNSYSDYLYPEEFAWGLKQFGTLFCLDYIEKNRPKTILEAGAGRSLFFDQNLKPEIDYWVADKSDFYGADFAKHLDQRKRTTFVESFIGEFNELLPENYFDLIFSISVLEHIPNEKVSTAFKDMARVVKPGGYIVHTIDLNAGEFRDKKEVFLDAINSANFSYDSDDNLELDYFSFEPILLEPFNTVYTRYYKKNDEIWINPKVPLYHTAAIVLVAQKKIVHNFI